MSFPQLAKPKDLPPRKPGRFACLDGYEFGVMTAMVLANVVALPLLNFTSPYPGCGWIWFAQLGLAASWMTWSSSPAPIRCAEAVSSERQFSLFQLMLVLAAWAVWLGYLRWENGGEVFDSILLLARGLLFALMVVPVAWLVIANNRKWWLVPILGVPLFIAVWDRLPQSYAHQLLDLELEPFVVISIWTLINMGVLYLLGLQGSTSRFAGTQAKQVVSHI